MSRPNYNIKAFGASMPTSAKRSSVGFGGYGGASSVFRTASQRGLAAALSASPSTAKATTTRSSGGGGMPVGFDYSSLLGQALSLSQSNSAFNASKFSS